MWRGDNFRIVETEAKLHFHILSLTFVLVRGVVMRHYDLQIFRRRNGMAKVTYAMSSNNAALVIKCETFSPIATADGNHLLYGMRCLTLLICMGKGARTSECGTIRKESCEKSSLNTTPSIINRRKVFRFCPSLVTIETLSRKLLIGERIASKFLSSPCARGRLDTAGNFTELSSVMMMFMVRYH